MRITQFETIYGRVNVDTVVHPKGRYKASFDEAEIGAADQFGWVAFGWSMMDTVAALLADREGLINEMMAGWSQPKH